MNANSADRIYYNIAIPYNPIVDGTSPAVYQQELNQAIVNKASDYYLSITRFTIPTANIPIMYPEIQPYPNTDINNTIYSVTITYGPPAGPATQTQQKYVQFVTSTINAPSPASPTADKPNVEITDYYFVYSYINFLTMINTALQTAFNALVGVPGGAEAPYFIYNEADDIISLIAQEQYYSLNQSPAPANIFKVYCNYALLPFIDGMNVNFGFGVDPDGKNIQFLIQNNHNNIYNTNYLSIPQEYDTLPNWNVFQSLSIVSNLLPTRHEFVPAKYLSASTQSGVVNSRGILTDFEPVLQNGPEARVNVQYFVQGPYRLINLLTDGPITKIDINIYWVDKKGNEYLLDLPVNSVLTMKLVFIKKSTYVGY